jgi:hypothetical protein
MSSGHHARATGTARRCARWIAVAVALALAAPVLAAPIGPLGDAARCEARQREVRAQLAAEHQACKADLDCVPWETDLMSCSGWVSRRSRPLEALSLELESVCGGALGAAAACPPLVGACVRGRCTSRPARRSGDCATWRRALASRVADTALACDDNEDCAAPMLPGEADPIAAARNWPDLAAAELREAEEVCGLPAEDRFAAGERVPITAFPVCQRGRCRLVADTPSASRWRRPALTSANCIETGLASLKQRAAPVTARFTVGRSGRAYAIEVDPPTAPADVRRAVTEVLASCQWRPGASQAEDPARIRVVLTLRFDR